MAAAAPPPRSRFLPQPVETSTRTSKRTQPNHNENASTVQANETVAPTAKPRKFLAEPFEESTRRSRRQDVDRPESKVKNSDPITSISNDPDTTPQATQKTPNGVRRFAPEPVETSTRSSRRKFAIEPIETTKRSNKDIAKKEEDDSPSQGRRKFLPEPVETTTVKRRWRSNTGDERETVSESEISSRSSSRKSSSHQRFSPELIETAKGSFRRGKKGTNSPIPGSPTHGTLYQAHSEAARSSDSPRESRFSAANLAKRHHHEERRPSYCVPSLPPIESDSSEEEALPSLTNSNSDTDNEHHHNHHHHRHRLSGIPETGSSFTHYVLSLADRKKLEEQAMAAYINHSTHEQVNHFAGEEDEDEEFTAMIVENGINPRTFRRSSQDELDLEMQNMRRHHEQLEQAKQELAADTAGASRFSAAALATRHHLNIGGPKAQPKPKKNPNDEFSKMLAAASPPMLGDDLVFPYTVSPKMTRCDVDQLPRPRRADSDDEQKTPAGTPSLWNANITVTNNSTTGLWMGFCQRTGEEASRPGTPIRSGIQTPAFEGPNPLGSRTPARSQVPSLWGGSSLTTRPPSRGWDVADDFTATIDEKLMREKQIDDEFPNSVITQIYNYLSLGYQSLARPFDEELSKISRIPIEELRKDDVVALNNPKGHIRAPESEGSWDQDDHEAVRCRRWEALRIYVREWARQSPTFANEHPLPTPGSKTTGLKGTRIDYFGATVRRGSWAQ